MLPFSGPVSQDPYMGLFVTEKSLQDTKLLIGVK